jgi:hypothetical protein
MWCKSGKHFGFGGQIFMIFILANTMKIYRPCLRSVFLPLSVLTLLVSQLPAQSESPLQGSHTNVIEGPPTGTTRGEIVPLFWKALIGESIVSVPLTSIEHFGVQTYDVDGVARVRELTITTKSQSMVRIYHMAPLSAVAVNAERTLKAIGGIAERLADEELNVPVKVFPATTHAHMVEYRTGEKADIDKLYQHLETAMKDYHARVLSPAQRESTIRQVKVGGQVEEVQE